jgi:hypothetical protein
MKGGNLNLLVWLVFILVPIFEELEPKNEIFRVGEKPIKVDPTVKSPSGKPHTVGVGG